MYQHILVCQALDLQKLRRFFKRNSCKPFPNVLTNSPETTSFWAWLLASGEWAPLFFCWLHPGTGPRAAALWRKLETWAVALWRPKKDNSSSVTPLPLLLPFVVGVKLDVSAVFSDSSLPSRWPLGIFLFDANLLTAGVLITQFDTPSAEPLVSFNFFGKFSLGRIVFDGDLRFLLSPIGFSFATKSFVNRTDLELFVTFACNNRMCLGENIVFLKLRFWNIPWLGLARKICLFVKAEKVVLMLRLF